MYPIILSTWSFGPTANKPGHDILARNGSSLDAVVAAATAVEDDPNINSVGVGGLPDASGRVSLDGCVMANPDRCGAVYYIRHHANPAAIARHVMERTIHISLAGDGADDFADRCGFPRRELLTPAAKAEWEKWAANPGNIDRAKFRGWIPPMNIEERWGRQDDGSVRMTGGQHPQPNHDTVSILALDSTGTLAGACSTSGMAFKVPGRVGDSPIIGHGLYVDQTEGKGAAAAATGNGELIMGVCGSFLAVELMRQGRPPADSIAEVLRRIVKKYKLNEDHQVAMIAMNSAGEWASAGLRPGFHHTITDEQGTRVEPAQAVIM
jgi:N4-(beta-N-acetylglucosaminyl)-L-asparaginase